MVVNAPSHMNMGSVSHIDEDKKYLVKDVHRYASLGLKLEDSLDGCFMVHNISESSLVVELKSKQYLYRSLIEFKKSVLGMHNETFSLGGWYFKVPR